MSDKSIRSIIERGDRIRCASAEELAAITSSLRGLAVHVMTLHDAACTPGVCVCSPEYIVQRLTVESYIAGQREQRSWIAGSTS